MAVSSCGYLLRISNQLQLAAAVRPSTFDLQQNYPNPFHPTTQIGYGLPEDGHVEIAIFNVVGQKISTLVSEIASAGFHYIMWDGRNDAGYAVPSGMYF